VYLEERFITSEKSILPSQSELYTIVKFSSDKITDVPKHAFSPPPKVESSVIRLTLKKTIDYGINNPEILIDFIKKGFSSPRKTLINSLSSNIEIDKQLKQGVLSNLGQNELVAIAKKNGFRTMQNMGHDLLLSGDLNYKEYDRVLSAG